MTDCTARYDTRRQELFDPGVIKLLRRISITGVVVLVVALSIHQVRSTLLDCLQMMSPGPIVCSAPEVTLLHIDTDPNTPGVQPSDLRLLNTTPTSANIAMPCPSDGRQQSLR